MPELYAMDEPVETAVAAIAAGWATPEEVADAVEARRTQRPLIGQLLLRHRKLNVHQVFEVLAEQAGSDKLFGQIAVEKGFTTDAEVDEMVFLQYWMTGPMWQTLVASRVLSPDQAESIQATTRKRLRRALEADFVACQQP